MTIKRRLGAMSAVAGLLATPGAALAQDSALAPSAVLSCLTRVAGAPAAPVYPPHLFESKQGDRLSVELEFRGPGEAPDVTFDKEVHNLDFKDEVRTFVKAYRAPCMAKGAAPVVLRQQFVFSPTDGRKLMPPPLSDKNDESRRLQMKCIVHEQKLTRPHYPQSALMDGEYGNIIARFRFVDPGLAPQVAFLAEPGWRPLRRAIEEYASGLRMPCLANGPNEVNFMFKFLHPEMVRAVMRDTSLVKLLAGGKDFALPAYFDFGTMDCPFDVNLTYRRPYLPNVVREIETSNAARMPLLEWMSKITINLDPETNLEVLGDSFNVSIPCGKLDLPASARPPSK